jgi:hypothetical protein
MESIKTYKAILLTVLGLVIVVSGSYVYMRNKPATKESVVKTTLRTLEGQVSRMYEGENKLVYSFDVPKSATSSVSMDEALVTVMDNGSLYAAVYMSYEGGRGYGSLDYINNVIAPRVAALTITGTTTIGSTIWTVAENQNSEWHVGQAGDGQWLIVIESRKALHDQIVETLESLSTK